MSQVLNIFRVRTFRHLSELRQWTTKTAHRCPFYIIKLFSQNRKQTAVRCADYVLHGGTKFWSEVIKQNKFARNRLYYSLIRKDPDIVEAKIVKSKSQIFR